MRKSGNVLGSLFFILVGIGIIAEAMRLHIGTPEQPQPGFLPLLCGAGLVVLSFVLLVKSWGKRSKESHSFGNLRPPTLLVTGLAVYVGIVSFVGYVISTTLLSALTLRVLESKSWKVIAAVSLILAIGSYLLFDRLLGVTLPRGILEGVF